MRFFLLLLLVSCSLPDLQKKSAPQVKYEGRENFTRNEVVAALNLLTLINDWPKLTSKLQAEHKISTELSSQLLYPLRPIWKETVKSTRDEAYTWNRTELRKILKCSKACECFFWYEIIADDQKLRVKFSKDEMQRMFEISKDRKLRSNAKCISSQKKNLPDILAYLKYRIGDYHSNLFVR